MEESNMKRKIIAIVTVVVILLCLLTWLVWPHTLSNILPFEDDSFIRFSIFSAERWVQDGVNYEDHYRFDNVTEPSSFEELSMILNTSKYRQDIRNLWPWKDNRYGDEIDASGSARIVYYLGNEDGKYVAVSFLSSSLITVSVGTEGVFEETDLRFYHPTNPDAFNKLKEYVKANDPDHG